MSCSETTQVWLVDLVASAGALEGIGHRVAAFRETLATPNSVLPSSTRANDRHALLVAQHLVIARFLARPIDVTALERTKTGKPVLRADLTGAISLSHTRGHALIAIGMRGPLGVDIEKPRQVRIPDRRRVLIELAARALANEPLVEGDAGFLQAWVRLEALAKADGRGIGTLLTAIGAVGPTRPATEVGDIARAYAQQHRVIVRDLALSPSVYDDEGPIYAALATQKPTDGCQPTPIIRLLPTTQPELLAFAGLYQTGEL